jgi:glycine amidinotransferase
MREDSFDWSWIEQDLGRQGPADSGQFEIMFDAAQCLRFGRDILLNVGNANHRLGATWLQRHLGPEYRVHVLDGIVDNHIDTTLMPLRPGVLLVNEGKLRGQWHKLPPPLRKWQRIPCTDIDETAYTEDAVLLASRSISANVLPLGLDRVVVGARYRQLIRDLERHGFEVVPVELRHSRVYAGGFHCITLDVSRDETLESYF